MCAIHRNVAFQLGYFWAADANVIKSSIRQHLWCLLNCIQIKQTSFLIQVNDRNNHKTWLFLYSTTNWTKGWNATTFFQTFTSQKEENFTQIANKIVLLNFLCVLFSVYFLLCTLLWNRFWYANTCWKFNYSVLKLESSKEANAQRKPGEW